MSAFQSLSSALASQTAPASILAIDVSGFSAVCVQLTGTFSATLQFEATADGVTYVAINATPPNSTTAVTSATSTGVWMIYCAALRIVRVRCSTYVSGAAVVTISEASSSSGGGWGGTSSLTPTVNITQGTAAALTPLLSFPINSTGAATAAQITLTDNGAVGNFSWCIGNSANSGDPARNDHVMTLGYNTRNGGGRAILTEPCFEWRVEDYYNPGSGPFIESHWQYYDATGAGFRPIAFQVNRTDGGYLTDATLNLRAVSMSYLAMNGTQYAKFEQSALNMLNGAQITTSGGCTFGNTSIGMPAAGFFTWTGRAELTSPADGKLSLKNAAETAGAGFDVTTDAVLKVRSKTQAAYATVDALGYAVSGTAGASFGPGVVTSITVVNGIITAIS